MEYINYNGKIVEEKSICISPNNRAFRYADGFFETMKMVKGRINLENCHFERLYNTLEIFKFPTSDFPVSTDIFKQILETARLNGNDSSARIRLTVFAGDGFINDHSPRLANYIIQAYPTPHIGYPLNSKGLVVDIYEDAVKPFDNFSRLKTNNALPYVMAGLWAKENGLDDALLLNPYGNISDATIANVFIVKDGHVKTPALSDGPVDGVMRKYLIKCLKQEGIPFAETSLTVEDILQASEVFFTNAIFGIKWVEKIASSRYTSELTSYLHEAFITKLSK